MTLTVQTSATCEMCRRTEGAEFPLVICGTAGADDGCGAHAWICELCARAPLLELNKASSRFMGRHRCQFTGLDAPTSQEQQIASIEACLEKAQADLQKATAKAAKTEAQLVELRTDALNGVGYLHDMRVERDRALEKAKTWFEAALARTGENKALRADVARLKGALEDVVAGDRWGTLAGHQGVMASVRAALAPAQPTSPERTRPADVSTEAESVDTSVCQTCGAKSGCLMGLHVYPRIGRREFIDCKNENDELKRKLQALSDSYDAIHETATASAARVKHLEQTLTLLDRRGGLGLDVHQWIESALNPVVEE